MLSHKFYAFLDEAGNFIEITKKVNHKDKSSLCMLEIPEEEMTYEEAKVYALELLNDMLNSEG